MSEKKIHAEEAVGLIIKRFIDELLRFEAKYEELQTTLAERNKEIESFEAKIKVVRDWANRTDARGYYWEAQHDIRRLLGSEG